MAEYYLYVPEEMTLFEFCDKAKVTPTNIAHWIEEDDKRVEAEERYEEASPEERLRLQLVKPPKPDTKTHQPISFSPHVHRLTILHKGGN